MAKIKIIKSELDDGKVMSRVYVLRKLEAAVDRKLPWGAISRFYSVRLHAGPQNRKNSGFRHADEGRVFTLNFSRHSSSGFGGGELILARAVCPIFLF